MGNRAAIWAVAAPLIALKVWVTVLLLWLSPSRHALEAVVATTWPWVVVIGALVAAPTAAWLRMARVRARRARLLRAEWMLEVPAESE